MINHLDNLLRHLFIAQIDEITSEDQVGFQPPDDKWRTTVVNSQKNALNGYLVDLRENRSLRSNVKTRELEKGVAIDTPAPRRIDCHYLITAWSSATVTSTVKPTEDEHALLYKVAGVLANNEPIIPKKIYEPNPLPKTFPDAIADAELPAKILAAEGFPKLAEFWGTMGRRWKPAVYLVVTLPVILKKQIAGPMVTTRITEYRHPGKPETAEAWIQIGGTINDTAGNPVGGAWVRLETLGDEPLQTTHTKERGDEKGRFTFAKLKEGTYKLRVRAAGFSEKTRNIEVPSATDNYDVKLT